MAIDIVVSGLYKSTSGNITGSIFLRSNGVSFPEEGWNDFVVVILSWWTENTLLSFMGGGDPFVCSFMDGPFEFRVRPGVDNLWRISFVEERVSTELVFDEVVCDGKMFIDILLNSSNLVLKECANNSWASPDIDVLTNMCEKLLSLCRGK